MAEGDVHTYFEDGRWKNRIEGGVRASNTSLHVIHNYDGGIESVRSFRPRAPRP
ncbi:hypothetical protein [Amycolatopsis vastitatis]|uniref:hypothetical protein n=1 Tax=Amycolatopsis vastitatis TaxID=1905142 RepID=UPI00142DB980|nr:hypothetical protein [Amycolatopsis vastitatis]